MRRLLLFEDDEKIAASVSRGLDEASFAVNHSGNGAATLQIDRASRILFFAPHPDDESLAGGGLLQRAAAAGAVVRVVFVTNGDNNPWPHRVMERQWRIKGEDRALWGMRRRDEALVALETLGLERGCAQFLNAPDQGLTQLLLAGGFEIIAQLRELIANFQPTLLVAPARFDLHPDHNALSVLLDLTLSAPEFQTVTRFFYAVHTRGLYHAARHDVCLELSQAEQERKRRAIECHRSQMILSRRRFLGHVKDRETFWPASTPQVLDDTHPVRFGKLADGVLTLLIRKPRRTISLRGSTLYLALQWDNEEYVSWNLQLPNNSGHIRLSDAEADIPIERAEVQFALANCWIHIPVGSIERSLTRIFVKHQPITLFYDAAGWREIPVEVDPRLRRTGSPSKCLAAETTV